MKMKMKMKMKTMAGVLVGFTFFTAVAGYADGEKSGKGALHDLRDFFRVDCRFHNVEHNPGASFCYASAVYQPNDDGFRDVQLAVGCDGQTLFKDGGRIQMESTLDRISPSLAATPGVEVFPHGQLKLEGTYTSELDIHLGRFSGLCFVHRLEEPRMDGLKALSELSDPIRWPSLTDGF